MRLMLTIGISALLMIASGSTQAAPAEPSTVTELAALCKTDANKCQELIGVVVATGVGAEKLPPCTSHLNLPELTTDILSWWTAHPDEADNGIVLGVANALNALKPC